MDKKIVVLGNGNDWCEISLNDLKKLENTKIINSKFPCNNNKFVDKIMKFQYSDNINKYIKIPFKSIWFKKFAKYICDNKESDLILIIYDRNKLANDINFLKYLRKYFKNIKLIYMFTNIAKISGASNNNFVEKLNDYYDVVYAFDPVDAEKYNFKYNPLLYSLYPVDTEGIKQDVFYVGRAKDRYSMLMKCYDKLNEMGLSSKFFVFNVLEDEQKYKDKITYNKLIPYKECLKNIKESNCLLDVIQGESTGFTIKVCEAVFYDKLLITTNKNVKDTPFYDERYILIIESAEDIKKEFFMNKNDIKYSLEGKKYFSVNRFVNQLLRDIEETK